MSRGRQLLDLSDRQRANDGRQGRERRHDEERRDSGDEERGAAPAHRPHPAQRAAAARAGSCAGSIHHVSKPSAYGGETAGRPNLFQ